MKTKVCLNCKEEKAINEFDRHKGYKGGVRSWCLKCKNAENLAHYHRNKHLNPYVYEKDKDIKLRRAYGISYAEYLTMLDTQQGGCAICGVTTNGKRKAFAVDHCHSSGKVRGLLCSKCNTAIGSLQEDVGIMLRAIEYVTAHKGDDQ